MIDDYGNVVNALTAGPDIAQGEINLDLRWSGGSPATSSNSDFSGTYLRGGTATLTWSAKEVPSSAFPNGFSFQSGTGVSDFTQFGRERNGVFLNSEEDDDDD